MTENGRLPDSDLATTYLYYPGSTNGRQLTAEAARHAEALATAFALKFGKPLYATDGYRDLETQWVVYRKYLAGTGAPAAYPGTSNHGWGKALDLASNVNSFSSDEHKWMRENAGKYGWEHPYWARQGGGREEAWHWEFNGGGKPAPRVQRPKAGEIGLGSKGEEAKRVQILLNQRLPGPNLVVDGDFGLLSAVAALRFQRQEGLSQLGRVGPVTLARLEGRQAAPETPSGPVVYLGPGTQKTEQVKNLQRWLKGTFRVLATLVVDGDYGPATTEAVKHWQRKAGLKPAGVIGPKSKARLDALGVEL